MYVKHPILLPQVKHTDYFGLKKERKRKRERGRESLSTQHSVKFNIISCCTNIEKPCLPLGSGKGFERCL